MSQPMQLKLAKPGVNTPTLKLNLNKGASFHVEIFWDCNPAHEDDLDIHAFEAQNNGNGAKVTNFGQVLSTYNTKKMNPQGLLTTNADGSFSTLSGGLSHTGDKRRQKNTEIITIDGSKLPAETNEVPIIATVHEADHGEGHEGGHEGEEEAAFADIEKVEVKITDNSGKVLGHYELSKEFGEFDVVQLGSFLRGDNGWEYAPVGTGHSGDLNDVLAVFS